MEGCGEYQLIMSFHLGLNVIKPALPSSKFLFCCLFKHRPSLLPRCGLVVAQLRARIVGTNTERPSPRSRDPTPNRNGPMVNALTRKTGLTLGPIIFETLLKHYFDRIAKVHESEESTRLRRE